MKASEGLRAAARLIVVGGFCQGALSKGSTHCAVGALLASGAEEAWEPWEHACVSRRMVNIAIFGDTERSIVSWNDQSGRTEKEVVDALYEAARIAESAELTDENWPEVAS